MEKVVIYLSKDKRVKLNNEGGLEAEEFVYDIGWVVRDEMPDSLILKGLQAAKTVIDSNVEKFF